MSFIKKAIEMSRNNDTAMDEDTPGDTPVPRSSTAKKSPVELAVEQAQHVGKYGEEKRGLLSLKSRRPIDNRVDNPPVEKYQRLPDLQGQRRAATKGLKWQERFF